jgi:hypothetical protein
MGTLCTGSTEINSSVTIADCITYSFFYTSIVMQIVELILTVPNPKNKFNSSYDQYIVDNKMSADWPSYVKNHEAVKMLRDYKC